VPQSSYQGYEDIDYFHPETLCGGLYFHQLVFYGHDKSGRQRIPQTLHWVTLGYPQLFDYCIEERYKAKTGNRFEKCLLTIERNRPAAPSYGEGVGYGRMAG
jgi:hypothetical protein